MKINADTLFAVMGDLPLAGCDGTWKSIFGRLMSWPVSKDSY